jgi:hypothetical protein
MPLFEFFPYCTNHAAIFKFEETAAGCGKNECRNAGVAEDEQLHVPVEAV